jgi:cyclopropane fatty-acyl-phospholipid synthase-like methyltransferase
MPRRKKMIDEHTNAIKEYYDILRWSGIDVSSAEGPELDKRIEFLLRTCRPDRDMPLLDLCCGNGRYSVALAQKGYKVTGIDFDEKSIEQARRRAHEQNVKVDLLCADINKANLRPGFGLIFSVQAFQHFTDDQRDSYLRKAKQLLVPGAKLFVEMPYFRCPRNGYEGRDEWEGYVQTYEGRYVPDTRQEITEMIFTRKEDGAQRKVTSRRRNYDVDEIDMILRAQGYRILNVYGDWDGRELNDDCCRMIFIATPIERDE